MPAEPRGAQAEPVDLAMWRRILALSENTMQPVIRNDLAVLVSLASTLAVEVERLEGKNKAKRRVLRTIYQCRLNHGNGTICRACWEQAEYESRERAALGTKGAGDV